MSWEHYPFISDCTCMYVCSHFLYPSTIHTHTHTHTHTQHEHPFISAMVNNGSIHYDHDRDGTHSQVAGCHVKFRNSMYDTFVAISYLNRQLAVSNQYMYVLYMWSWVCHGMIMSVSWDDHECVMWWSWVCHVTWCHLLSYRWCTTLMRVQIGNHVL